MLCLYNSILSCAYPVVLLKDSSFRTSFGQRNGERTVRSIRTVKILCVVLCAYPLKQLKDSSFRTSFGQRNGELCSPSFFVLLSSPAAQYLLDCKHATQWRALCKTAPLGDGALLEP